MDVVTESYRLLSKFTESVALYTNLMTQQGEPSYDEKLKPSVDAFRAFKDYFEANKIYIPEKAAGEIAQSVQKVVGTANVWKYIVHMRDG